MASNTISILVKAQDQASSVLRDVNNELDKGSSSAGRFGDSFSRMGGAVGKAALAVSAAAGAALGAAGAIGFNFNSSVEQAQAKLMAFMKDGNKVAETLAWVKDEAAKTQFSFTDMADAAANLTPVSKSTGKSLEDLIKQAEILAALNPAEGLTGATFSLREALSGDWVSIVDRFNLPRKRIMELKDQGVPAMEIISRTLNEMGIDYGLVAKQGETVSARFDQVKDKLTMMAGAAAKPIFDRVSQELGNLGNVDFAGLGNRMAEIVSGAIKMVDDFIPKVKDLAGKFWELGVQVWDYLGPKFAALWDSISTKLIPILSDLWHGVIEPLLPVIGELLVGAIGLVVDTIKLAIDAFSFVYQKVKEGDPIWTALITILGTVAGALAMSAAFAAFQTGMTIIQTVTIPAVMAKFGALAGMLTAPIVMPALVIGAVIAALVVIQNKAQETMAVLDDVSASIEGARKSQMDAMKTTQELLRNGTPEQKARAQKLLNSGLLTRASGGPVMGGQSYLVGEHGPELFTPTGSGSITNNASSSININFSGSVSMNNKDDIEYLARRIMSFMDKNQRLSARGVGA